MKKTLTQNDTITQTELFKPQVKTAILIDGGFYRRRANCRPGCKSASDAAEELISYCKKHLNNNEENRILYRIFYYDCLPMKKKMQLPISKDLFDYSKTDIFTWSESFMKELSTKRKLALRLGKLSEAQARYELKPSSLRALCEKEKSFDQITDDDFALQVDQKGVDMKIGLDIASMAYKSLVDQIILIAGDSDFVPAAKLARREGIDFILDSMGGPMKPELREHVDGIDTFVGNKK